MKASVSMPRIYLSPSLQEFNPYVGGGNEEYYMNLVADAMEPYLNASGIEFTRNNPSMSLSQAIAQSNQGNYDLHVALHSNASPEPQKGKNQGVQIYYYPTSASGQRAAEAVAKDYRNIYLNPNDVSVIPTTGLAEVRRTKAPAILIETAFHDNAQDADWIRSNIDAIAKSVSKSIADFLGVPFVAP